VLHEALRGRRTALVRLALWSVLEAAPAVLSGWAIAHGLDDGFLAGRLSVGLCWLGFLTVAILVGAWGTRRVVRCLADIVEPVRDRVVELVVMAALRHATRLEPSTEQAGVARLTQQTEIVREALAGTLMASRGFVVAVVSALAGLVSLHAWFALPALAALLVALAGLALVLRAQVAVQRRQVLAEEQISDSTTRVVAGLRDATACGAEDEAHALVGTHVDAQAAAARQSAWLAALSSLVVGVGGWLPLALVLVAASGLLRRGVTPGVIAGVVAYLTQTIQPALQTLVQALTTSGSWLVTTAGRIREVTVPTSTVAAGESRPPAHRQPAGRDEPAGHELRLRQVTFRYGPHSDPVLDALDLVIPEGDHLAVVGPSGAGKSTFAALLCGMLRPNAGEVLIGGVPMDRFDAQTLAERRVVIPQEAYVFAGTVWENVTYHQPDAAHAQVETAVAATGLAPLLERLGGYDATVDPRTLSAGERQLIALTRALLSPARIAVLDEATCHLDPAAEARVERAFAQRPGTLVVVSHRISSALRARRILVVDGPHPCLGDHETLLVSSELYRQLVGRWADVDVQPSAPRDRRATSEPLRLPYRPTSRPGGPLRPSR
jgi:ATP-binding cassette subfamily C protein